MKQNRLNNEENMKYNWSIGKCPVRNNKFTIEKISYNGIHEDNCY